MISLSVIMSFYSFGLDISNDYSPRNNRLPLRKGTNYIILHTTEAPERSSLNSVKRFGSCNYLVLPDGGVKRIVERGRLSNHAGRSVWEGVYNISLYSIGIEVVGYHNKSITKAQEKALKELLSQLKAIYDIADDRVLTHSMVAYGRPNRWHKHSHRGRKRCGMIFADDGVRKSIGLKSKPSHDPDVKAGRLVSADPELYRCLYGDECVAPVGNVIKDGVSAWTIARDMYDHFSTVYIFPDGTNLRGNDIVEWSSIPEGTKVLVGADSSIDPESFEGLQLINGKTAWSIARSEYNSASTIYILPDGRVRTGAELSEENLAALPAGTSVLVGYVYGGLVTKGRSAYSVAGKSWNHPSTFYYYRGSVLSGGQVAESSIQDGSIILFRR